MEFVDNHEDVRYTPGTRIFAGGISCYSLIFKEFHFTRHVPAIASERPERRWWIKGIKVSEWWLRAKDAASDPASSSCIGLDTRNALWGRNPVATSLKPPHSASSREVSTPEAPSWADSMERLHLPGEMPECRRMLAPRGVLLGDNLPDYIHLPRPVTRSPAAPNR